MPYRAATASQNAAAKTRASTRTAKTCSIQREFNGQYLHFRIENHTFRRKWVRSLEYGEMPLIIDQEIGIGIGYDDCQAFESGFCFGPRRCGIPISESMTS